MPLLYTLLAAIVGMMIITFAMMLAYAAGHDAATKRSSTLMTAFAEAEQKLLDEVTKLEGDAPLIRQKLDEQASLIATLKSGQPSDPTALLNLALRMEAVHQALVAGLTPQTPTGTTGTPDTGTTTPPDSTTTAPPTGDAGSTTTAPTDAVTTPPGDTTPTP